jgi:hypothetical protein
MANYTSIDVDLPEAIKILRNQKYAYTSTVDGLKLNKALDMAVIALERELYSKERH